MYPGAVDDSAADLLIGAYLRGSTDAGQANLLYGEGITSGSSTLPTDTDVLFSGASASDYLGWAVDGGDIDGDDLADVFTGDGLSDIVWGAAAYDPSTVSNGGGAFVLFSVRE